MIDEKIIEFLEHSNWIEGEMRAIALDDAKKAWNYAYRNRFKIGLESILEIHKILTKRIRQDIAGKLRRCDVWIGGKRKFFISEALLKDELKDVYTTMNSFAYEKGKEEEFAKHCHIMFESVHPFEDGNGRVGRILYNIHRLNLHLPVHIIHEGDEQYLYYSWFK